MSKNRFWIPVAIIACWLPAIIGVARSAVYQWSTTASSNASADPQINWREGQPPSSVNDSARAMMAALAGYRDDISGSLTTTGTASAYLVSTNQGLPNPPTDGQMLAITVNVTNGIAPTLSADGGGTFAIQSSAGIAIPAGTLILGSPYSLKFSVSNNAWILRDFYPSPLIIPLGAMMPYTGTAVPNSNFVFPAGQCLSTTTYAAYWVFLGSPASGSCGGGQFQIIDISGRVPAGLDTMPGFSAANRLTSSSTGCGTAFTSVGTACLNGLESTTLVANLIPNLSSTGTISGTAATVNTPQSASGAFALFVSIPSAGSPPSIPFSNSVWTFVNSFPVTGSASVATSGTGGTAPVHPRVMPVVGVTYLLRVI